MNQKCSVCKEPAAGYHFGAFTCEGCKSFFGRTYNNPTSVSECKNGGNCEINKKNRTSCKACRLKKCLLAGMSKSSSRYGRRSNWFKVSHALQLEKEEKESEKSQAVRSFGLYSPMILSRSCNDERDAASTTQNNLTNHANDVSTNSLNNRLLSHNWHINFQPQLSITSLSASSNQLTSSLIDNQMQQQSSIGMHYSLPFLTDSHRSLLESVSRNESESESFSDDDRLLDVESKSSSSRVSPFTFTTNKMDEPTLSNSRVSINGSLMLMDTRNPYLNAIPSMITSAVHSARGGDSLLISPNPGGLADERDEPIDLSMRASNSSSNKSSEIEKKEKNQINDSNNLSMEESADPLDLTFDATPLKLNLSQS